MVRPVPIYGTKPWGQHVTPGYTQLSSPHPISSARSLRFSPLGASATARVVVVGLCSQKGQPGRGLGHKRWESVVAGGLMEESRRGNDRAFIGWRPATGTSQARGDCDAPTSSLENAEEGGRVVESRAPSTSPASTFTMLLALGLDTDEFPHDPPHLGSIVVGTVMFRDLILSSAAPFLRGRNNGARRREAGKDRGTASAHPRCCAAGGTGQAIERGRVGGMAGVCGDGAGHRRDASAWSEEGASWAGRDRGHCCVGPSSPHGCLVVYVQSAGYLLVALTARKRVASLPLQRCDVPRLACRPHHRPAETSQMFGCCRSGKTRHNSLALLPQPSPRHPRLLCLCWRRRGRRVGRWLWPPHGYTPTTCRPCLGGDDSSFTCLKGGCVHRERMLCILCGFKKRCDEPLQ